MTQIFLHIYPVINSDTENSATTSLRVSREDAMKLLQGQTIKQPVLAGEGVTI